MIPLDCRSERHIYGVKKVNRPDVHLCNDGYVNIDSVTSAESRKNEPNDII